MPVDPIQRQGPGLGVPMPRVGDGTAGPGRAGEALAGTPGFGQWLADAVARVNQAQLDADKLSMALAAGEPVELHQVMIATEQANLLLNLTVQLRNKALEAYQEIMRLQV